MSRKIRKCISILLACALLTVRVPAVGAAGGAEQAAAAETRTEIQEEPAETEDCTDTDDLLPDTGHGFSEKTQDVEKTPSGSTVNSPGAEGRVVQGDPQMIPEAGKTENPEYTAETEAAAGADGTAEEEKTAESDYTAGPETAAEADTAAETDYTAGADTEAEPEEMAEENAAVGPEGAGEMNAAAGPEGAGEMNAAAGSEGAGEAGAEAEPEGAAGSNSAAETDGVGETNAEAGPEGAGKTNAAAEPEEANAAADPDTAVETENAASDNAADMKKAAEPEETDHTGNAEDTPESPETEDDTEEGNETAEIADYEYIFSGTDYKDRLILDAAGEDREVIRIAVDGTENGELINVKTGDGNDASYLAEITVAAPDGSEGAETLFCRVTILPLPVEIIWEWDDPVYFDGEVHCPKACYTDVNGGTVELAAAIGDKTAGDEAPSGTPDGEGCGVVTGASVNAGSYTAAAVISDPNYQAENPAYRYTILPAAVPVTWDSTLLYTYDGQPHHPKAVYVAIRTEEAAETAETVCSLEEGITAADAGKYSVSVRLFENEPDRYDGGLIFKTLDEAGNYVAATGSEQTVSFEIMPQPVDISDVNWGTLPSVYSMEEQPVVPEVKSAEGYSIPLIVSYHENGHDFTGIGAPKDTGNYTAVAVIADEDGHENRRNYVFVCGETAVPSASAEYVIAPYKIRIIPEDGQKKVFGEDEKALKPYAFRIEAEKDARSGELSQPSVKLKPAAIRKEILAECGKQILKRKSGEKPGTYRFEPNINPKNYDITVADENPFTIQKLKFDTAETITSRENSFHVAITNLGKKDLPADRNIEKKLVISARFPSERHGISFSEDINTFIDSASRGIRLTGTEQTITVKETQYSTRKGGKKKWKWKGNLPAGTVLTLEIYGKGSGEDWYRVSDPGTMTVTKQPVSMAFDSTAMMTGADDYLGKNDRIRLISRDAGVGEYVLIMYRGGTTCRRLNVEDFQPVEDNGGAGHHGQPIRAIFLDALNLEFAEAAWAFTYDTLAFPVTGIRYENRGDTISITWPETGRIEHISVEGAAAVEYKKGSLVTEGETVEYPVRFSGKKLIHAGAEIRAVYTDQAGNEGTGTAKAERSTVKTPITMQIRPEPNGAGYLNGSAGVLIVSGTACSCEPVCVTVAGMSASAYASQQDIWSDDSGSWESIFDMSLLPETEEFSITAEYADVNGRGDSMTVRYDAFVAEPVLASPVFEAMSHISGMAEPGTAVTLQTGDRVYPVAVDAFGHFSMNGVPVMFGGDTFRIQVTDIAGNTSTAAYTVPEAEELSAVTANMAPMGKIYYDAGGYEGAASQVYIATPVKLADVAAGGVSVPLLMGMSYKVGNLAIDPADGGFTVQSHVFAGEGFEGMTNGEGSDNAKEDGEGSGRNTSDNYDPGEGSGRITTDDYDTGEGSVCVYPQEPTMQQLRDSSGFHYRFGELIPAPQSDVVWLVTEQMLTVKDSSRMLQLEPYNYSFIEAEQRAANEEAYQEYLDYRRYQEGRI